MGSRTPPDGTTLDDWEAQARGTESDGTYRARLTAVIEADQVAAEGRVTQPDAPLPEGEVRNLLEAARSRFVRTTPSSGTLVEGEEALVRAASSAALKDGGRAEPTAIARIEALEIPIAINVAQKAVNTAETVSTIDVLPPFRLCAPRTWQLLKRMKQRHRS